MAKAKKTARKSGDPQTKGEKAGNDRLYTAQVRELVNLMVANELTSLEIVNGDLKVSLGRGLAVAAHAQMAPAAMATVPMATQPAPAAAATLTAPAETTAKSNLLEIKSPMVGTFYAAPSPDSEAFVKMGSQVTDDSVVCIVEAMKVMNEIKAEVSGKVVEVVVKNGQPVEFGQVLFRVQP